MWSESILFRSVSGHSCRDKNITSEYWVKVGQNSLKSKKREFREQRKKLQVKEYEGKVRNGTAELAPTFERH